MLAAARTSLSAPQRTTVRLTLGRVGKHLLAAFHLLKVKVTTTQATKVIWKATVTFETKAKPKHHELAEGSGNRKLSRWTMDTAVFIPKG